MEGHPYPDIRRVTVDQSTLWLAAGWRDFKANPVVSLVYGLLFTIGGYALVLGLGQMGMQSLILPLVGGFMLVAPILAVGLYEASRRREANETVRVGICISAFRRNPIQLASYGLTLLILYLTWLMLALLIFAVFYNERPPALDSFLIEVLVAPQAPLFLIVGTAVGGVLAWVAFSISVVALPMMLDRDVSAIYAMAASVEATRKNTKVMIGWAAMIALITLVGMATFFVGLAIALPLVGHASWHAYRAMIGSRP
ncbi:hypothetical protein C882_0997 [Caenispirillum salinarum AK4]|uniref:Integral membrane protein n=1 Tax=Caenispirillum salinarum AK4 TaxID=1238182 RepID=K9HD08_9PROT|nr:hypothetical protein C882_0997 [Caenispirillum salinarum AK4]